MDEPVSRGATRRLYDRIATHFAETRSTPWPEVTDFVSRVGRPELALDLGCANGRHVPALAAVAPKVVAVDISRALLQRGRSDHGAIAEWMQADALSLPIKTDAIDLALYIATLHHIPTRSERIRSLDELARVLDPTGCALVSVWSVSHERFDETEGHDRYVPWTLPSGESYDRFYHLYDLEEFGADLRRSELPVIRTFEPAGNCYGVVRGGTRTE